MASKEEIRNPSIDKVHSQTNVPETNIPTVEVVPPTIAPSNIGNLRLGMNSIRSAPGFPFPQTLPSVGEPSTNSRPVVALGTPVNEPPSPFPSILTPEPENISPSSPLMMAPSFRLGRADVASGPVVAATSVPINVDEAPDAAISEAASETITSLSNTESRTRPEARCAESPPVASTLVPLDDGASSVRSTSSTKMPGSVVNLTLGEARVLAEHPSQSEIVNSAMDSGVVSVAGPSPSGSASSPTLIPHNSGVPQCQYLPRKFSASSAAPQKHIIILGAGISGLQTALTLLESEQTKHFKVTIIAEYLPGERNSDKYTSPEAGGNWRSHVGLGPEDSDVRDYDLATYKSWDALLDGPGENEFVKESGLGRREARYYWGAEYGDWSKIWFQQSVHGFRWLDLAKERQRTPHPNGMVENIPPGALKGMSYQTFCFDPEKHLKFLKKKILQLGVRIIQRKIDTGGELQGVVREAKRILLADINGEEYTRKKGFSALLEDASNSIRFSKLKTKAKKGLRASVCLDQGDDADSNRIDPDSINIFALINCAGLNTRDFITQAEKNRLYPVRGLTILVRGEVPTSRTYANIPGAQPDEMTYVVPRPGTGTTIIGGCKQVKFDVGEDHERLYNRILERVKESQLAEELRILPGGEFDIIRKHVGYRPGRQGGPRVETEGRVKGLWVLHNYGHSGGGYQGSIGCARKIMNEIYDLELGKKLPV